MALVGEGKIPPEIMRQATEQTQQLSPVEAAHVHAILKQTLEKLALVGVITVDPKVQAQELTQSVGEEITRMIAEQKRLEQRFEELVSLQHVLRHQPNKSKLMENQAELQKVAEALRQSTKQLCRNLKDNPNVAENMLKVASERQALQLLLNNSLNELVVFSKAQPIIESVMAQEAAEVQMNETIEHERLTTAAVRQLRNDLREEKVDHEEKIKDKKRTLALLKDDLKSLKMETAVSTRYHARDSSALNEHERGLQRTQLDDQRRELALVQQQIEIERAVHATTSDFLKKLAARLQSDSVNWGQRHDDDLSNRDKDLETLRLQHARDTTELRRMEDKFRTELALKQERQMKASEEHEKAQLDEVRNQRIVRATTTIQAYFRGWKVRKEAAGSKKGAKKGGKKKK